ncbi:MAG: dihydrofolate reductase [Streptococcaceae bacterium]|jgi:dihydrofolate reductase|nr:dihydrofolate reductase [Streptococcaceae bacterium]
MRKVAGIWAEDEARLIGQDGHLPWRLPAELAHFKETTMGCDILMGRKTYDGMNRRILPGRQTFVLTHDQALQSTDQVAVVHSPEEALAISLKDLYVIGGAEVFKVFWPHLTELYQSVVHGTFEGDVQFPDDLSFDAFRLADETRHEADAKNPYAFTMKHFIKNV